jgi:long-chain acyl-CoA synthetase
MGVALSYAEVDRLSLNFAGFLVNVLGMKKGDRIAIQMPNTLQYPVCVIGALRAGLTVVNTNPLYTPREMEQQFQDAGVKAVVILETFAAKLESIRGRLPELRHVIVATIGDLLGPVKGRIVNLAVRHVRKMVPAFRLPDAIPFRMSVTGGHGGFMRPHLGPDDIAFLQYTGGTTGTSKGAMLLHRNLLANVAQHRVWLKSLLVDGEEVIITPLPLYHIFAMTVNFITFFVIGSKNILITNPRDMKAFLGDMAVHPFTVITGVNTLFNGMMNQPQISSIDFSRLKLSIGGGMAVLRPVAEKWTKLTGNLLMEGYGLTECSPVVTIHPFDGQQRIGTIGIPLPATDVMVCDEKGQEVPVGNHGELCVKGPQVMPGYWNNELETRESFFGDYFRTGDIGYMDAEGFFYIVDRKKEMINVSGFNVYPKEVEDVISAHPKVLEVGVKGMRDEQGLEYPAAFVVKNEASLTEEEVMTYCRKELTGYKVPRQVFFRAELPKTPVGKILRKDLV